jgi:hypothetical protein
MPPRAVSVPDTPAVRAARQALRQYSPPALVNHCERSYLFAAAYAAEADIAHDEELLLVATLLHDLALEPPFDNVTLPFEEASGHVAWMFAAGAGWSQDRRDRAAQTIVNHMREVSAEEHPEGHLLGVATSLDISGAHQELWPQRLLSEVVSRYPRLDLATRFAACFTAQAQRKPSSAAAQSVAHGIERKLANNRLERLG